MQVTRLLLLASMGLIVQEKQPLQKNYPNISQAIILKVQLEYSSVQPQRTFHAYWDCRTWVWIFTITQVTAIFIRVFSKR